MTAVDALFGLWLTPIEGPEAYAAVRRGLLPTR